MRQLPLIAQSIQKLTIRSVLYGQEQVGQALVSHSLSSETETKQSHLQSGRVEKRNQRGKPVRSVG